MKISYSIIRVLQYLQIKMIKESVIKESLIDYIEFWHTYANYRQSHQLKERLTTRHS